MASAAPQQQQRRPSSRRRSGDAPPQQAAAGVVEIGVSEPWFRALRDGAKTVEGRLHKGKFAALRPGTVLVVTRSSAGAAQARSASPPSSSSARTRPFVAVVTRVLRYASFAEYLCQEGLARTLPGVKSLEDGVAVYRAFYSAEDEEQHGVAAVHVHVVRAT